MRHLAVLATTALLVIGCGSDSPTEPGLEPLNGSMSARIDGAAWKATTALAVSYTGGILAFAGSDANSTTIGVGLIPTGPGTYPIGLNQPTNANLTFGASGSWGATPHQGSGSVTLTSFTANRATGTFAFTAEPVSGTGASGTRVVTEGVFDVKF